MVVKNKTHSSPLELEARVKKLETYWYVTLALAGILGIGGGWITTRLSQLESESRALLSTVQKTKEAAISDIDGARDRAVEETAIQAKSEASKQVTTFLRKQLVTGVTAVGALNGNHEQHLDVTIPFKDSLGRSIAFDLVPRVLVIADRQSAEDDIAWSVNLLSVTKQGFSIRIRSTDQHREGNPGWNGSVGVQWAAFEESVGP